MWRNYFTVGIRALTKNKTYAFINILGLALGLAACLMILLFVRYELSYDKGLPGSSQAYQFQSSFTDTDTGEVDKLQMAPYVAKDLLKKDFPQIENAVHALAAGPVVLKGGQAYSTEDFRFVDGNLLDILRFPLVSGNAKTALDQAGTIVLTETEARKYFGSSDPVGQTLTLSTRGQQTDYRVTGVLKDLPKNSHFSASMIARYDPKSYWADQDDFLTQWGWQSGWVYLRLRPGADAAAINAQMEAFEKRNIPDQVFGGQRTNQGDIAEFKLTNIADIHLGEAQAAAMTPGNDRRSIITFGVIAALILAMACVNFTNLATARASQRAREVALRKVLGANRKQLVTQFLGESVLVAGVAMLLALAFVELALPSFARFLDADLKMRYFGEGGLLLPILGLVLLVGAAGGVYPALYLSRFSRPRCSRPTSPRPRRTAPAACATCWWSPVRGLDRPDHLHRGGVRPDRARPHRRSRLQAGRPAAGRKHGPARDVSGHRNADPRAQADRRCDRGRAEQHRHRHPQQHQHGRAGARPAGTDQHRRLYCRCRLLRYNGHRARGRAAVPGEPADGRFDHALSRRPRRGAGLGAEGHKCRCQRARGAAARPRHAAAGGGEDRQGAGGS
jgi:ABC-type antimicrobial peptide transport system permease subunit